jgi:uncharacterized damage-inducible protein DinB
MYKLIDLFEATQKERNNFFLLFEDLPEKIWYGKLEEKLWSPENTFRHLLSSITWLKNYFPGLEIEDSPHGLQYGTKPEGKVPLEEMKKEFERITSKLKSGMEKLTPEQEEEVIDSGFGVNTRAKLIAGMLLHEHTHFGQIVSTMKRVGGYSDQDLREKLMSALKKQKE